MKKIVISPSHYITVLSAGPPGPPMTSTTRAPPPFQPVNTNPLYPGQGAGQGGGMGGPYDMYPGQTRAGFNSIIPFNQTRQIHTMPGEARDTVHRSSCRYTHSDASSIFKAVGVSKTSFY